ncbi:hypothetical protein A4L_29 [Anabaena phage A-4L]|uniref:Uncharacterized protein n=1 Tax=Anabaena phage A-4L TaxID=1357732 RepID=A0A059PY42_9CAUD|nr:hypothetical protein A4L_29 [Anabaena phage A-4L]AGR48556.1 hypothetical protein A4L_29 [Anabaena phage A-4L]
MGGAAIGGILGGVQLVAGISQANSQANAQRQSLQAQAQTTVDASRIRQMEILQARDQSRFNSSMNELARQQNYQNQTFLIQRQLLQEQMDAETTKQQAEQQRLQTMSGIEQKDRQTEQQMVGAEVNFQQTLQQLAQQLGVVNAQSSQQLTGAEDATKELGQRLDTRDVLAMASGVGLGSSTSSQQQNADLLGTIDKVAKVLQGTQVGMEVQQRMTELASASSESERNIKLSELGSYLSDSDFMRNIANIQASATNQNVDSTMGVNAAARETAVNAINAADMMNRQTDTVNNDLAEMGYQVQTSAVNSSQNNAMSGINAQYGSIGGNTFAGLLSSGVNAFNTYQGVLGQQNALNQQKQMTYLNSGILSNGATNNNTFKGYN